MADENDVLTQIGTVPTWAPGAAGTVVVTPPTEVDIGAALEGADTPSALNPFITESAVGPLGAVQRVNRLITSPEILALNTSPITLVAGAAGKVLLPFFGVLVYKVNTTPYTWGGVQVRVGYPFIETVIAFALSGNLNNGVDAIAGALGTFTDGALEPDIVGEPMMISNDIDDSTDGDGTFDVTILYREVDVS